MDNTHQPPGGEPQDFWATQEIRPETGQPGPAGQPGTPAPHGGPQPPRRGKALWWGAGLALVAVLAGGGAFAATHLASNTSPAAATTGASGPTGQAAQLNTLLNSASSPASEAASATFGTTSSGTTSSGTTAASNRPCTTRATRLKAAGHPFAARYALRRCRHALARVRLLGGLHGQFTFKTKTGYKTLAYERGVIRSISGSDVTVQATDGTTWTWVLVSNTVVRHGGQKVAGSELAEGQQVFAGGPVVSGVYDARLIVIRPAGSASPTPSSSPATGS